MSIEAGLLSLDCYYVPEGWSSPLQNQCFDFISWPTVTGSGSSDRWRKPPESLSGREFLLFCMRLYESK